MKKFFIRSGIIFVWLALIFSALYWPKWKLLNREANSINVFVWGDILEPSVIADFEKETGVKVTLSYYSSNEELIVKLKATKGEGYDLVIPSDYAVNVLVKEDLLKKIDKQKLTHFNSINPSLLGHYYDPENTYSIPFEWELYCFGIDKNYFSAHPSKPSWKMVFDPSVVNYKITMTNDPIDSIDFAAFYLFNEAEHPLNPDQEDKIRELLVMQRPWIAAYASFRGDYYLATQNVSLVVASSSYILRTKKLFDFVDLVVPEEGTFMTIENICIPKASKNEDLVYRFINHLTTPQSALTHHQAYSYFPATLHTLDVPGIDPKASKILHSSPKDFKKYHFIKNLLPQEATRDMWVYVKTEEPSK